MSHTTTYQEIRAELGLFLGISDNPAVWSPEDTARVERIIRRGGRRFYYPEDAGAGSHTWSFLQRTAVVPLTQGQTSYPLPADFVRLTGEPTLPGIGQPLHEVTDEEFRQLRAAEAISGQPVYYTVRRRDGSDLGYELALHPAPLDETTLDIRYVYDPPAIGLNSPPPVPANHAECLLAAVLSVADESLNYETQSEGRHLERYRRLLAASIESDRSLGGTTGVKE